MIRYMNGKKKERGSRLLGILAIAALLAIFTAGPVQATLLNLQLLDSPDISAAFIDVIYTADTDTFTATGFATQLDDDGVGPSHDIWGGSYTLEATIDDLGALAAGGTVSYGGSIPTLGLSGTLLTGDLRAFGFPNGGGDPLEFLFDVTGGLIAPLFGPVVGLTLSNTNFSGSFAADFDNLFFGISGTGQAVNNASPVPEPATMFLLGSGLIGLVGVRRKFKA